MNEPLDKSAIQKQLTALINNLLRNAEVHISNARLLAENEPFGELVLLSLYDDAAVKSDLWARLKIISEWLKQTEELYAKQFPSDFPRTAGRYDLTNRPPGYRTRFEIFKTVVEAAETNSLWSAEIIEHDPLIVKKRRLPDLEG